MTQAMFRLQMAFSLLMILVAASVCSAADSSSKLTAGATAQLYERQDIESRVLAKLEKGEELQPLAQSVALGSWYMVKTVKGLVGWVQATDVNASNRVDETFRDTAGVGEPKRSVGAVNPCLAYVDSLHEALWKKYCEQYRQTPGCALPAQVSGSLKRDHTTARDECIKGFPTKAITSQ